MDLIANIPLIGGFLSTVLPFVIVLGIVVFVHEYGHYIVARWCGIRSEVFSIGFGPVIWSHSDRRGTLWQVAALPLGGYVKFLGDSDGSSRADAVTLDHMAPAERAQTFHGASVGRRMLTVLAGPFANFLLTIVVFAAIVMWQGVPTERPTIGEIQVQMAGDQPLLPGDVVLEVNGAPVEGFDTIYRTALDMAEPGPMHFRVERDGSRIDVEAPYAFPALIAGVSPLSPASKAGLRAGDLVLSVNGRPVTAFEDFRQQVMQSLDETLTLEVLRDGSTVTLTVTPTLQDAEDGDGGFEKRPMIGAAGAPLYLPATETPMPWTAVGYGALRMVDVITQSLNGLKHVITGEISADNLQGPLGIAQISGETAQQGFVNFVVLIGVISTAIGMLNLFPIPVLDGGHFMAFLIEAVRGRPPSPAAMQIAMSIGLGLILLLMVFATYNDIMRMMS
ncbi:MAG: RIP metalloprotease RseP [Rhodobacteraceae bacterium]|nr:RIP metalloprotease RseP [Paracoccaceae bacterium]